MLETILNVSGRSGLYKLVSRSPKLLVVETLDESKKKLPVYPSEQVASLHDISIYLNDGKDIPLGKVFENIKTQLDVKEETTINPKQATTDDLKTWFEKMLPDFDRDRVRGGDIKKVILWYNILIKNGITDFYEEEVEEEKI